LAQKSISTKQLSGNDKKGQRGRKIVGKRQKLGDRVEEGEMEEHFLKKKWKKKPNHEEMANGWRGKRNLAISHPLIPPPADD
jgi:IS5 family transposase